MTEVKYYINVKTSLTLSNEQKMELLAEFKYAISDFSITHPDLKIIIGRELSNEDIMEGLGKIQQDDSRSIYNCVFYDEAQGRHHCCNPVVKSNKCKGVCKNHSLKP